MKGFDKKFRDLPDYILKITHQIWEDKDVESIREYYAKGIPVRSPAGVVYGPDAVVKATYATLEEFPDRQLLGEDVIWIGNEHDGYLSSHRILTRATHLNDGVYGKATGTSSGLGGSMHIFSKKYNFFGGHGIVGGQIPLGTGISFGDKYFKRDNVTLCFMGEGAVRQGTFHESIN